MLPSDVTAVAVLNTQYMHAIMQLESKEYCQTLQLRTEKLLNAMNYSHILGFLYSCNPNIQKGDHKFKASLLYLGRS